MKANSVTLLLSACGLTSAAAVTITSVSTKSLLSTADSPSSSNVSTTDVSTSSLATSSWKATVPGQIFPFSRTRPVIGTIYLKPYDSRPSIALSSSTTSSEDDAPASATPSWKVVDVKVNVDDEEIQSLKLKGPIDDFDSKDWHWVTVNTRTDEVVTPSSTSFTTSASSSATTTSEQSETHIFIHMGEDGKLTEVTNTKDFPLTFPSGLSDTLATTTKNSKRAVPQTPTTTTSAESSSSSSSSSIITTPASSTPSITDASTDEITTTSLDYFHNFEHWSKLKFTTLTVRPHTSYSETVFTRTDSAFFYTELMLSFPASTTTFTQPVHPSLAALKLLIDQEKSYMHSIMDEEYWTERMKSCGYKKRDVEAQPTRVVERVDPAYTDPAASKEGVVSPRGELDERAVDPACYDPKASKKGVICPRPEVDERAVDPACYDPKASKKGVICPRPEVDERAVDPACYDPKASKKGVICPRPI